MSNCYRMSSKNHPLNGKYSSFPVPNEYDLEAKFVSFQGASPIERLMVGTPNVTAHNHPHFYNEYQQLLVADYNWWVKQPKFDASYNNTIIALEDIFRIS